MPRRYGGSCLLRILDPEARYGACLRRILPNYYSKFFNCSAHFSDCQTCSMSQKYVQNAFPARPGPNWGSSRRSSRPPSRLATQHLWRSRSPSVHPLFSPVSYTHLTLPTIYSV